MSDLPRLELSEIMTLFDDESVREKLTVMSKWEAVCDDGRNPRDELTEEKVNDFLVLGKTYKVTLTLEEM